MPMIKYKECETEMSDKAKFCPKCGAENAVKFCPECCKQLSSKANMCPNCGYSFGSNYNQAISNGAKSKVAAALLAFFLGGFGAHNFYLGYTGKAVVQLLLGTVGWLLFFIGPVVVGIWAFVEFILILTGSINKDAHGNDIV